MVPTTTTSTAMNVRMRHSDIFDICVLTSGEFTILYQKMDHSQDTITSLPQKRLCREVDYYSFDMQKRDELLNVYTNKVLQFKNPTVYRLQELWFGGFLAFDLDTVHYISRSNLS